uniref:Acetylglutamate kinase n=1 Tax=Sciadococcus taiwanensis TaxID=3028030 RepID=A0A9Y1I1Z1_9RHOD|nr:acetylglutamate kinase [Sciadococcus taiwanensis]
MLDDISKAEVLTEALPYIQKFHNCAIVIKYGGAAMKDPALKEKVISDLVFLSSVGVKPVFVHGGGPEINQWLAKINIQPQFKEGVRVTDAATMELVEMVLAGKVNKELVALINKSGGSAVGLCGKDGNLIKTRKPEDSEIGFVGEIKNIDIHLVETLLNTNYIPVIASIGMDNTAQTYNINADIVAGEIAAALSAEKLILLTDTKGIYQDIHNSNSLIRILDIQEARNLFNKGIISGGMLPKVNCCIRALAQGVKSAHIIDGRISHALLLEIFTDKGIGSMLIGSPI